MADPTADETAPARTESRLAALLDGYCVPAGHFDELCVVDGTPRAQWEGFAISGDLTREHLSRAQARIDRQIHENGVTYNVYAAADALPMTPLPAPTTRTGLLVRGQEPTHVHMEPYPAKLPPRWDQVGYRSIFAAQGAGAKPAYAD